MSIDWQKYKMKRLNKIRICKICGKVIDNSKRTIQKRTKFCSIECVENNREEKRLRRLK
tara:strand:- start:552 stop:728 length:177 start_codon:yes stop_codon:yes gene_type:complete